MEARLRSVLTDEASVTSISSKGRLEAYVVSRTSGGHDTLTSRIREALQATELPSGAADLRVDRLDDHATVPSVKPVPITCLVVTPMKERLARFGIPERDVVAKVREYAASRGNHGERVDSLRQLNIRSPEGLLVPLPEIAELRVEQQPSHIVRTWPPDIQP